MKIASGRSGLWALLAFALATATFAQQEEFYMNVEYGFFDGIAPLTDPTPQQLSAVVCETQKWLSRGLQNATGNPAVTLKALNIDFVRSNSSFGMNFTADVRTSDGSPVPGINALITGLDPLLNPSLNETQYITDFIYLAVPLDDSANYFSNVDSMSFEGEPGSPRAVGEGALPEATCEETMAPSGATTPPPGGNETDAFGGNPGGNPFPNETDAIGGNPGGNPFPNETDAIGGNPGGNPFPNETDAPGGTPGGNETATVNPFPNETEAPGGNVTEAPGGNVTEAPGGNGTLPPGGNETLPPGGNETLPPGQGNNTAAPTMAPTVSAAPSPDLGPVTRQAIKSKFIVSNLDFIASSDQVNSSGLGESWPVFAEEVVRNITRDNREARRSLRYGGMEERHLLVAGVDPGSAYVESIVRGSCGENAHPDAACHDVEATYTLLLRGEDPALVERDYTDATAIAVNDGTYQSVMEAVDPETPLFIGIIPPPATPAPTDPPDNDKSGGGDDGMAAWLIALIVLLCVLCCLCTLCALFYLMNKNKQNEDKELAPYDEEGFAYDFLIPPNQKPQTEVDDEDATRNVEEDGEEQFEDEDDAGLAKNIGDDDDDGDDAVVVMAEEISDDDKAGEDSDAEEEDSDNDEDEVRAIEASPDDEENNLVDVDDEQEAPPDADGPLGEHEEPDGLRASEVDGQGDDEEPAGGEDWDDEAPADSEAQNEAEDWDNDDDGKAQAGDEEDWDEGDDDEEDEEGWDDEDEK